MLVLSCIVLGVPRRTPPPIVTPNFIGVYAVTGWLGACVRTYGCMRTFAQFSMRQLADEGRSGLRTLEND